jgi:hypothetical protein
VKITVTTSVRIETADGNSTSIVETVRDSGLDDPRFVVAESARVLVVAAERVLAALLGEQQEAATRKIGSGPNYGARIYGVTP